MQIVNVIEYNETILSIVSFEATEEGIAKAEEIFGEKMMENGGNLADVEHDLDDGYFVGINGYELYINHSEVKK